MIQFKWHVMSLLFGLEVVFPLKTTDAVNFVSRRVMWEWGWGRERNKNMWAGSLWSCPSLCNSTSLDLEAEGSMLHKRKKKIRNKHGLGRLGTSVG